MAATNSYLEVVKQYFTTVGGSGKSKSSLKKNEVSVVSEGLWCHRLCSGGVTSRRARCLSFLRGCGTIGAGRYIFS